MRVVIAHDYLTQRGGAERVVLAMLRAFPDARVITSAYAPDQTFVEFGDAMVETLMPRHAPLVGRDPRYALPVLAPLFSRHVVRDADVVVCSSSGWAHGIGSTAPKVVYCHTPPRWLHEPGDYIRDSSLATRLGTAIARRALAGWDSRAAASARLYLANSTVVASRIWRAYGREARILHPPSTLDPEGPKTAVAGLESGFLLSIGRSRGYKNMAAVYEGARLAGVPLVVVGGPDFRSVDDSQLRWLYANSSALVAAAYEDFGLTPVEAMAFGKPVLALRARGYLDTVVEGRTGLFFDAPEPPAIAAAVERLSSATFDPDGIREHAATFSINRFTTALTGIVEEVVG